MDTATLIYKQNTVSGDAFYNFEIPSLIQKIKNDCTWKMGDLKSIVVTDTSSQKIILTALHAQTEIISRNDGIAMHLHVLEGTLKFKTKKVSKILESGQRYSLGEPLKYKIEAMEETIFLLTIIPKN